MAAPLLATLSAAARAAFPIISSAVSRGVSRNATQALLQAAGLGIRRTSLLSIYNAIAEERSAASFLRNMRPTFRPDPRRLPVAISRLLRRYSFTVELRGRDSLTNARVSRWVTIALDSLRTRREIEEIALEPEITDSKPDTFEVEEAIIDSGRRAGEAGSIFPVTPLA